MKDELTEREAANFVVNSIFTDVEKAWPEIDRTLRSLPVYRDKFIIDDERATILDLFLAMFAFEFGALKNLVPVEQAARLFSFGLECIDPDSLDYARQEIALYEKAADAALKASENPAFAIPARLVVRWLAERTKSFEVEILGDKFIDPLLIMGVTDLLFRLIGLGRWKDIREHFVLV